MKVIRAVSVEDAWLKAKTLLHTEGVICPSRAGDTLMHPEPVTTYYENPTQRVLADPVRDANPTFHLMEALWMLSGRRDVAFLRLFNKRMETFSDDSETFHGAYGYRWRQHFELEDGPDDNGDQIAKAIRCLRADPKSRRVVIQMWDPRADLWSPEEIQQRGSVPKDLPCNTALYLDGRLGALNMTVTNRSNDIVWGCYGANVVHMSLLQEYIAAMVGLPIGWYCQVSNNWHAYCDIWAKQGIRAGTLDVGLYQGTVRPLVDDPETFNQELVRFLEEVEFHRERLWIPIFHNQFFTHVAVPMALAWFQYKEGDFKSAFNTLKFGMSDKNDWSMAVTQWLRRRQAGRSSAQGDQVL